MAVKNDKLSRGCLKSQGSREESLKIEIELLF